jgi:S1-C subfamily serine protease
VTRAITTLSGHVRHGNSGGPAIDGQGRVEAMVFAARIGSDSGYGIPSDVIERELRRAGTAAVSTNGCPG